MDSLTNLDTTFLHLETDQTPMHVGGVLLFAPPGKGRMTFARFRRHIAARLQTARVFRQRLYMPPAAIANPLWIEDADFNPDNHLQHRVLPGPLSHASLESLCSAFFSERMRRDRPMWEMLYVDTADRDDGFAVILKVHHAALDGVSAEAVVSGILDETVAPRALPPDTWQPEKRPSMGAVLRRRVEDLRHAPARAGELLASSAGLFAKRTLTPRYWKLPRYFAAPTTPFNAQVTTPERHYTCVQLSLPLLKAIKSGLPDLTLNDVVLALCAGATRRYLEDGDSLPEQSLVAMAPVSRRPQEKTCSEGNQVSSMLIDLATDIADPVARLRRIHENVQLAKEYNREVPFDMLLNMLPVAGPALALSAYARMHLGRRVPPIFNMVVTNVPGPKKPMYLDGAPLRSVSGMVGVYDGMALAFMVMSYVDSLAIGITSTPAAVADPQRLARCLEEAVQELARALLPESADDSGKSAA